MVHFVFLCEAAQRDWEGGDGRGGAKVDQKSFSHLAEKLDWVEMSDGKVYKRQDQQGKEKVACINRY